MESLFKNLSVRMYKGNDVWEDVGVMGSMLDKIMKAKNAGQTTSSACGGTPIKEEEFPEKCAVTSASVFNFYGGSSAVDALKFYKGQQQERMNVLLLDCGDMRNALFTASQFPNDGQTKLNLHVCNKSPLYVARNVFLTYVMLNDSFDPTRDSLYLWNLWYSCLWDHPTNNRFVTDLTKLMKESPTWTADSAIKISNETLESVSYIYKSWMKTATDTKVFYSMGLWQRDEFTNHSAYLHSQELNVKGKDKKVMDWGYEITPRICGKIPFGKLMDKTLSSPGSIMDEIHSFSDEGYCADTRNAKFYRCNATLMTPERRRWQVHYLSTPFDAYFPVPEGKVKKLQSELRSRKTNLYKYCLSELEGRVIELRSRKNLVSFHFHTHGFSDLDKLPKTDKNRFQIIYSFDLAERVGLAKLIPATIGSLAEDDPDAVLVTGTQTLGSPITSTVAEYLQKSLQCPISMIPTVYDAILKNHSQLGRPISAKVNEFASKDNINLTWTKAPPFSNNVKLALSPALKSVVDQLKAGNHLEVVQAMVKRCNWVDGVVQEILQTGDEATESSGGDEVIGKFVIRSCMESEKEYKILFGVKDFELKDSNDVSVSYDETLSSTYCNRITLTFPGDTKSNVQVPWPIKIDDINGSLEKKDNEWTYNLLLKKNLI